MKLFENLFIEARKGRVQLQLNYKKNDPAFCAYIIRQARTVSPKVLFDELIRNAIDAIYKQFEKDTKKSGLVCAFPIGGGAFAVTDNGCGIDPALATTSLIMLGESGSSRADEAVSGTGQHFGVGMKQLLPFFDLYYFSKTTSSPIISFKLAILKNGLVDIDDGIVMHEVASLPGDNSFAIGEKSRGSTGVGASKHAKSIQQFFAQNDHGSYVVAKPKQSGLKGWQALVGKKARNQDRAVVRWVNERYAEAPCEIKIARTAKGNDGVGAFLTVTGLLEKFKRAGAPSLPVAEHLEGYGQVLLHFSAGRIDAGNHGDIPTKSIAAIQLHERIVLPSMSDSAHKRLLSQLGLRHLADRGLRLIVQLLDTERFDMTNDRQHIADLTKGGSVELPSLVEAIAKTVEIPDEILSMERTLSAETAKHEVKGCEEWLKEFAFGGSVNTRRNGSANGGNPSNDRDEPRNEGTQKNPQLWCHWPRRFNKPPATNEGQDGGRKGESIRGHAVVEVSWDLPYNGDDSQLLSFTPPSPAYPAGALSLCPDHPVHKTGLEMTRNALAGVANEAVADEIVARAYRATKKSAIQSQLTFMVTQGLVGSLSEVDDAAVRSLLAWSYSDSITVTQRRSALLS